MASKFLLFASILLLATAMAPLAKAQLGGLGSLLGLIRISGTVFCSLDGSRVTNGATNPVFSNAAVQVQCGSSRTVVSSTLTNSAGVFSILLDPITTLLSSLLSDCNLAVTTPLSNCNASLPTGGILQSPLQLVGRTVQGLLGSVFSLVPSGFNFIPGLLG